MKCFYILLLTLVVGCTGNSNQNAVVKNQPTDNELQPQPPAVEPNAIIHQQDETDPGPIPDAEQPKPELSDEQPGSAADSDVETPSDVEASETAKTSETTKRGAATSEESTTVVDAKTEPQTEEEAALDQNQPPERFILFAPGGPLIVDVVLRLNGEDYQATHQRLVEEALAAADEDQDGRPTWEEIANSPRFIYGQFGNLAIDSEEKKRQLIRMYDRNRNGLVDRDELPRFLTRNAGGARAFSLRSSNEYRNDNRTRSLVRLALDTNHDGTISGEEISTAASQLLQRDSDDDEIVVLNDFKDSLDPRQGQMSNRRRTNEPDTALLISDRLKWSYADYSLRELYAYGDRLSLGDWPMVPSLFGQLDQDQDEILDQDEIKRLAEVPAHIRLRAEFGAEPDSPANNEEQNNEEKSNEKQSNEESAPSLQIEIMAAEIENYIVAIHRHGSRISVELRDTEIEFFVNEDPALINFRRVAQSQFAMLDKDQNGYLDEEEFPDRLPGFNVPLEAVDQNGDSQVYEEELARFLDLRQAAFRGQVRARAADQEDALFTALDDDGDGRLNAEEIHRTPDRMRSLDRNEDGRVQSQEIPGSMVVGFIRGNPQQDNALFAMPANAATRRAEQAPRWFRGMDANGDGAISSREFLGPDDKFRGLDRNRDGFVGADEVQQMVSES